VSRRGDHWANVLARRTISGGGIGHNLPQEVPQAFAQAAVDVGGY
jgi:hypothetical protein